MFRNHDEFATVPDGYRVTDADVADRAFDDLAARLFPALHDVDAIVAEIVDDAPIGRHSSGVLADDVTRGGHHFAGNLYLPTLLLTIGGR